MENYKSLYRKWRPRTFSDVCGQEHITKVLQNQVKNQKISHAYLFCGTRGTGKTTCAKILAKAVNCENPVDGNPCNVCFSCEGIESGRVMDVIEMDAASNNSVDNIREMREDVAFTPGISQKKVYIIDEVHMLSTGAFNALLKTLEEPPPHIVFILATTEFNKIPATILSRCQRHDFRRILPETIAERVKYVAAEENISIENEAVNLIASLASGAMRDALSILEVSAGDSGNKIVTFDYVSQISGYFDREKIINIVEYTADKNTKDTLKLFWEMYRQSLDCSNFCVSLLEMFRNIQVSKMFKNPYPYIELSESHAEVIIQTAKKFTNSEVLKCCSLINDTIINLSRYTANKKIAVEMLIIKLCEGKTGQTNNNDNNIAVDVIGANISKKNAVQTESPAVNPSNSSNADKNPRSFSKYAEFIEEIAKENKMIVPFLKSGRCIIDSENKKIIIYIDAEFKIGILKMPENFSLIKSNLYKFADSGFSVSIEANTALKENSGDKKNENSIDDIIALTE